MNISDSRSESESSAVNAQVEELAEEYLSRLRNGESPTLEEYLASYPHLEEELNEVLGAVALMQEFVPDAETNPHDLKPSSYQPPRQLGEYRIVRELGRGGMGVVYEAEHSTMRRRVALKVLFPHMVDRGNVLERFLREARAAGRLHHSNIVPVFEVGTIDGHHYYAMQRIRGQNLDQVIADLRKMESEGKPDGGEMAESLHGKHSASQRLYTGQFEHLSSDGQDSSQADRDEDLISQSPTEVVSVDETLSGVAGGSSTDSFTEVGSQRDTYYHRVARIGLQVSDALAYAHEQGILHRDIKPANLILDTGGTVWVTDFGLARSDDDDLTLTGDILGTLRYMAPERFEGEADARSDIYSLGLTLYELCTLRYGFDQEDRGELVRQVMNGQPPSPRRICPAVPRDLETIILKSISRETHGRYSNAAKMSEDLRLFLQDRPIRARRSLYIEHGWRWCRRNPWMATTWLSLAVLLMIIFVGSILFNLYAQGLIANLGLTKARMEQSNRDLSNAYADLELANRVTKASLYQASFRTAQAERKNQLGGRHESCLEAIRSAADLLPELDMDDQQRAKRVTELRNEAIATHTLPSIRTVGIHATSDFSSATVAFDFDRNRYAASGRTIELRAYPSGELQSSIPQPTYRAASILFSDDGDLIATTHQTESATQQKNLVRVWDLKSNETLFEATLDFDVRQVLLSPNNDLVAARGSHQVCLYSMSDSTKPLATREFPSTAEMASFLNDGRIATVGNWEYVDLWDPIRDETSELKIVAVGSAISLCRKSNRLAVGMQSGLMHLFDLDDPDREPLELRKHFDSVTRIFISPDDRLVLSSAWDGTTRLWDSHSGEELKRIENQMLTSGFGGEAVKFACLTGQKSFNVFEVTGTPNVKSYYGNRLLPQRRDATFCSVNPNLVAVATASHVELWDLESDRIVHTIRCNRSFDVRFNSDATRVLTSGSDGLRLWKLSGVQSPEFSELSTELLEAYTDHYAFQMDAAEDLSRAVYVTQDRRAFLVPLHSPDDRLELDTPWDVLDVAMSSDGRYIAVAAEKGRGLLVFSGLDGRLLATLDQESVAQFDFSPDNRLLICNANEKRLLYRTDDWKLIQRTDGILNSVAPCAFFPDGKAIAAVKDRFRIELIRASDMSSLATLDNGRRLKLGSISFSRDGSKMAVTMRDRFEVWDLARLRGKLDDLDLNWNESP